mmetsp:Transcript_52931/g.92343  ORF Transcript_52931/g.92343 Transcript_52931/m.92343 type:complete len:232 (-) Transcript_52931:390-1085(-)
MCQNQDAFCPDRGFSAELDRLAQNGRCWCGYLRRHPSPDLLYRDFIRAQQQHRKVAPDRADSAGGDEALCGQCGLCAVNLRRAGRYQHHRGVILCRADREYRGGGSGGACHERKQWQPSQRAADLGHGAAHYIAPLGGKPAPPHAVLLHGCIVRTVSRHDVTHLGVDVHTRPTAGAPGERGRHQALDCRQPVRCGMGHPQGPCGVPQPSVCHAPAEHHGSVEQRRQRVSLH